MQKTNKLFRLLAGLLAVLMLSICIPVSAFADEGEDKMGGHKPTVTITVRRYVDGDELDEVKIPVTLGDRLLDSLEQNKAAITENDKYEVKSYSDPIGFPLNNVRVLFDVTVKACLETVVTTKEVVLNYYDQTNDVQVKEEKATVDASATVLDQSLIKLPEGYTLDPNNTYAITEDGYVYIGMYEIPSTKEVVLNYYDQTNNVQVKEEKATVDASATVLDQSLIKLPEGYKLDPNNTYAITEDGYVYIGLYAEPTTKVVKLNFYDEVNDRQVSEGAVTVDSTATTVNTAYLALPNGYELIEEGELQINDGWVYVAVKPIENTRVIGLNYYDEVNKVQVCEREMVVDAAATSIAGSSVPALEGYELLIGDTLQINDNWVYIGVKPLETKSVGLNFFDEENYEQVEERYIDVPMDAETVNTSDIELPDGYEFITTGNIEINDNWVYVGVKCVKTLRIYWAVDNKDASFANGNEDAWTQELTWKHVNDDIAMPEVNVPDGYVLNGWSVSGQEGEFWKASLKTMNVGDKYVEDENGGIISITANIVTKEEAESGSSDNSDDNSTTVTSTNSNNNNTQVVKAEAPADNTAKVMPQTGLTAETPVVFGVMMVAALAGAGAYLFAIRKKLN